MFLRREKTASMDGSRAESVACKHLKQSGLRVQYRNYRARRGEIDIIALDGDTVVFVEVRYRQSNAYGSAAESIDHRKQQRIVRAAQEFLQAQELTDKVACRFDTVCISSSTERQDLCGKSGSYHIEWLRNAFQS